MINITGTKYKKMEDGLYVQNITLEDGGEYSCKAYQVSTSTSSIVERTVTLKVKREYG
jgi:hypothetical protein